ncbi:MAG: sulfite reductase [Marinosulfonomonas sp.]|nr:MAG: sulfite reductase [Marinosulfonomonas sp.]
MKQNFPPKVVTANDLTSGEVVYLSASDQWVLRHNEAELLIDAGYASARLGFAEAQQGHVVGPYLAGAIAGTSGPAPVHFREVFRARGPSNLFHGKQSEQENVSIQ